MTPYKQLEHLFTKASHIDHAKHILNWDEAVIMPSGGGQIRAESMATLSGLHRDLLATPVNLDLIAQAKEQTNLTPQETRNLFLIEKKIKISLCTPKDLLQKMTTHSILTEQAWRTLRAENNWDAFMPLMKETLSYVKEFSEVLADTLNMNPYDALIDLYSPGINQSIIDPIFDTLKEKLPELLKIAEEKQKEKAVIQPVGPFAIDKQKALCMEVMQAIGFDFNRGRLDISHHPFCGAEPEDTRITTRYSESDFISGLLGVCHEAGHAMYQFNLASEWKRQPAGEALGMSVHESQSLLMEMHACRSEAFTHFLSPKLIKHFGNQPAFDPDNLYRLFTRVERGLIRVDADEITYPFHVILRYELEKGLMNDDIRVEELPELWNEKMQEYLGVSPKNDHTNGVMQDVHWPSGAFGYFPAYNLGSLMAAQFFHHATKAHPEINDKLTNGDFSTLNEWLNTNVRSHGSLLDNNQLLTQSLGEGINPQYFLDHVKRRYC